MKLCLPLNYLDNFNHISREYNKVKCNFRFTNKIDDFYKIDVLVVPSVSDGFAQVVIEALSEKYSCCSDAVGSSEYINEKFGNVFPRYSIDKLIKILDKINIESLNNKISFIEKKFSSLNNQIISTEENFTNLSNKLS